MTDTALIPRLTRLAAAVALPALVLGTAPANAEEDIVGSAEYLQSCVSCHGIGGRGDGPVAEFLKVDVPDLTKLSERNDGVFPFNRVVRVIDGRAAVGAHGSRPMPVWGRRYSREMTGPPQTAEFPWNRIAVEQMVRGRILELVNYLEAIQQPGGGERLLEPNGMEDAE